MKWRWDFPFLACARQKYPAAALRFVHWSNRSYVLNNFSLEDRLYLANCVETRPSAGLLLLFGFSLQKERQKDRKTDVLEIGELVS